MPVKPEGLPSIGYIALALRTALVHARQPDSNAFPVHALAAKEFVDGANRGEVYCVLPLPDNVVVNSNGRCIYLCITSAQSCIRVLNYSTSPARYDWNSAHFGHPGLTRFYSSWIGERYVRVFRSNPLLDKVKGQDGRPAVLDAREGSLEVFFKVEREWRDAIAAALEEALEAL